MEDMAPEQLFRANKRRRIFRKRNADEDDDQPGKDVATPQDATGPNDHDWDEPSTSIVKRPASKKHGIGFSTSSANPQAAASPTETALVLAESQEDPTQNDRFVKPATSRVVVEDKHLTAYVDSKLAELRPFTSTSRSLTPAPSSNLSRPTAEEQKPSATTPAPPLATRHQASTKPPRRRRQPPTLDPNAQTRDLLVETILSESQGPQMYSLPAPPRQLQPPADSPTMDADEAAAQAFKRQFLADRAERSRRRKPPAAAATGPRGVQAQQTSSGPKLGGSRSQRVKMKALEEAAKNTGKK